MVLDTSVLEGANSELELLMRVVVLDAAVEEVNKK
jgi:hypothetical protein